MSEYNRKVHLVGRISSFLIIVALLGVPFLTSLFFKEEIDWGTTFAAIGSVLMVFGPVAVIEFLSYLPIIGAGGQYLSFVTGNVMNMKIPAATSGRKIAGVETGSDEGDAISMISIAISSLVTTAVLFVGMVLAAQLLPLLNSPVLAPAFANVMPAIMGALGFPVIVRDLRTSWLPALISIVLTVGLSYGTFMSKQGPMMILFLFISLAWSFFLYKRGQAQKAGAREVSERA
ncbi:hypothetical protein LJC51_08625 [Lachnospiraceae bacterium OttesenSCG-928-J05]|nr:hypothetical protein [Lachnospiraceae bacterium OttesenSCG-928-J05]